MYKQHIHYGPADNADQAVSLQNLSQNHHGTGGKLEQSMVKSTCEQPLKLNHLPADKLFLGYNDAALQGGLKPLLEAYFPTPCSYEKY